MSEPSDSIFSSGSMQKSFLAHLPLISLAAIHLTTNQTSSIISPEFLLILISTEAYWMQKCWLYTLANISSRSLHDALLLNLLIFALHWHWRLKFLASFNFNWSQFVPNTHKYSWVQGRYALTNVLKYALSTTPAVSVCVRWNVTEGLFTVLTL